MYVYLFKVMIILFILEYFLIYFLVYMEWVDFIEIYLLRLGESSLE